MLRQSRDQELAHDTQPSSGGNSLINNIYNINIYNLACILVQLEDLEYMNTGEYKGKFFKD